MATGAAMHAVRGKRRRLKKQDEYLWTIRVGHVGNTVLGASHIPQRLGCVEVCIGLSAETFEGVCWIVRPYKLNTTALHNHANGSPSKQNNSLTHCITRPSLTKAISPYNPSLRIGPAIAPASQSCLPPPCTLILPTRVLPH